MPERPWRDDEEDWSETGGDYGDDADDSAATFPCPECGAAIYEDLDHCPSCGHWLTDADRHPSRRTRLIAAVLLAIFLLAVIAGTISTF